MKWRDLGLIGVLATLGGASASAQEVPSPGLCSAPEHSQFDFWVGKWDVYRTGTEGLVARSLIEKLYGGCAVRENWMPVRGGGGGSLNNYVTAEGKWRQTWVDSSNARVDFAGGLVGEAMVLTGFWKDVNGPGRSGHVRMTFTPADDESVRQLGEVSIDEGKTWRPFFDLTYRPAAN